MNVVLLQTAPPFLKQTTIVIIVKKEKTSDQPQTVFFAQTMVLQVRLL